ncbi:MAG: hypothetical protein IPP48_04350 [Chitinophagaceae bacterium]|nr:hypothetical protein [Chitinophagaceae bacterium]
MRFIHLIKKKIFLALAVLFTATGAMAQDAAATAEKTVTSSYNMLAILLVVMTAVLAFVIWGLGQVLVTLSRQAMEKERKASKTSAAAMIVFLVLLSNATFAQDVTAKVLPNYGGLSATTFLHVCSSNCNRGFCCIISNIFYS